MFHTASKTRMRAPGTLLAAALACGLASFAGIAALSDALAP